jgi:diguanylate cyclase (GGDEF)-like protein
MGLRTKLVLVVSTVVAAAFAGAGVLTIRQLEESLLRGVETRARALLSAMSPPCAIAMGEGDFETVDNYLGQASQGEVAQTLALRHLMILDPRGRVYAHSEPTRFGERPEDPFYARALHSPEPLFRHRREPGQPALLEAAAAISSGVRWGTLVAGFDLAREERQLVAARHRVLLAALGLGGAAALVLFVLITISVLAPLRRLAETAEALARGERDRRIHLRGRDELAQLGRRFNRMAEELSLQTHGLEAKVRERAAQLIEKNEELSVVNERLAEAVTLLERLAVTDGLTGLYNRRKFEEALLLEVRRNLRRDHPFGLLMMDVDNFKHYNDAHGHPAGDEVLRRLAQVFRQTFRSLDLVARYGGEEFVVLLLETELQGASVAAEKIRAAVEAAEFLHTREQPGGRLTLSVGVAAFPEHGHSPEDVLESADRALYAAKRSGRNRVVTAEDPRSPHA